MWKRQSLFYPMIVLLVVTLFSTLTAGYFINYPFLSRSLQDNLEAHARNTMDEVRVQMDRDLRRLVMQAHALPQWNAALTTAMARLAEKEGSTLDPFRKDLDRLAFLMEADVMIALGPGHRVLYSNVPQVVEKAPYSALELEPLLRDPGGWSAVEVWGHWHALAATSLGEGESPPIRLIVGIHIAKRLMRHLQARRQSTLVFIPDGGEPVGGAGLDNWLPVDPARYHQVIRESRPLLALDNEREQGWYYAPLTLMNENFCLAMPVSPASYHQTLSESRARLGWTSAAIAAFILLLGVGLNLLFLIPLRRLQEKALLMVEACSDKGMELGPASSHREARGNELVVLEDAFEAASRTLYAHIGQLLTQKETFERLARKDPLTGLGNRRMMAEILEKSVAQHRRKGRQLAVLYLDLDQFKPINDTLGHDIGDLLLQEAAHRMAGCLRESDVAFRLGGDEFAALLTECAGSNHALMVAERIRKEIGHPYVLKEHTCFVGASIGIALFPDHAKQADELLKRADDALYAVKKSGRNACRVYDLALFAQPDDGAKG
ncbi:MAG: GGDEF domain-containing protein [Magnetococcales bacterium]|nr:GGDEF domain-containing protein [Magnetococcales bacterium]